MLIVDEYIVLRVLAGHRPAGLPPVGPIAIPGYRYYRLLQSVFDPRGGQLSALLASVDLTAIVEPDPSIVEVVDPRSLFGQAARLNARFGKLGLLVAETLAAALVCESDLWFGSDRNVGRRVGGGRRRARRRSARGLSLRTAG